ncbi:MAG: hypothetical protein KC933_14630 [Myxococcales bacterium]|nr:hypothetical protein [Myxococcales bacterium]MCB9647376.1 hypothetical protein [Deltaproteobacteria bacterium]
MRAREHLPHTVAGLALLVVATSPSGLRAATSTVSEARQPAGDLSALGVEPLLPDLGDDSGDDFRLRVYGFADFTLSRTFLPEGSGFEAFVVDKSTFYVGALNTYFDSSFDDWKSLIEIRFLYLPHGSPVADGRVDTTVVDYADIYRDVRYGSIEIERAWVEYQVARWLTIRAGQWLTPYGVWNVDHASPTIIGARRPYVIAEELLPERQTGLQFIGSFDVGRTTVGYHLTVSNGRGPVDAYLDFDENKALGARLFVDAPTIDLKAGVSAYYGRFTSLSEETRLDAERILVTERTLAEQFDELSLAADLKWTWSHLIVQAEVVVNQRRYTEGGRPLNPADVQTLTPDQTLSGAYGLVAYETPLFGITPYAMVEYEKGRINLLRISGAWGFTGGLNWRPHPRVTLKAQVLVSKQLGDASSPFTNTTITLADGQIAWAF